MTAAVATVFDAKRYFDKLRAIDEKDKKDIFKAQIKKQQAFIENVSLINRKTEIEEGSLEATAYGNLYAEYAGYLDIFISRLDNFNFAKASASDTAAMQRSIADVCAHLDESIDKITQLNRVYAGTDLNYNGIDDSLEGYMKTTAPKEKEKDSSSKRTLIAGALIFGAVLSVGGIIKSAITDYVDDYDYDVIIDNDYDYEDYSNYDGELMTIPEWYYYQHSLVEPTSENTVTLSDGTEVIIGHTTVGDLLDEGMDISNLYYSYDDDFYSDYDYYGIKDADNDVIPERKYNDLYVYPSGYGSATIYDYGDTRITISFSSFEDADAYTLDYDECVITGMDITYYSDSRGTPFQYEDFDINTTFEEFLNSYEDYEIDNTYYEDDYEAVYITTDDKMSISMYHSFPDTYRNSDYYNIDIHSYR